MGSCESKIFEIKLSNYIKKNLIKQNYGDPDNSFSIGSEYPPIIEQIKYKLWLTKVSEPARVNIQK